MERKLTAILSADVKGYSRLMGEDEEATIRTLTSYREVMTSIIQQHRGRVVDSPGDNLLAEFASAVDAVQGAVEIQHELQRKNVELPDERKMHYRIGINVGDVIVEGERLYGDGVNIAARLEGLAEPGGICISGTVYDQVENKLTLNYAYVGEQEVKNIAKPVRMYRVRIQPESVVTGEAIGTTSPRPSGRGYRHRIVLVGAVVLLGAGIVALRGFFSSPFPGQPQEIALPCLAAALPPNQASALQVPDKPSLVVLPFVNISGEPAQEYFGDGITADLISGLSKLSGLFVIARTSAFTYKGKAVKVQEIGKELGVRYVVEGSLRKAERQVRITAQLVDASTGYDLWTEHYDRPWQEIFALQDEIVQKIVQTLNLQLTLQERGILVRKRTDNLEAYDYFLRGVSASERGTKEATEQARQLFEKAVELDPQYAEAYAALGGTYIRERLYGWESRLPLVSERVFELGHRAAALDDSLPDAHMLLSWAPLFRVDTGRTSQTGQQAITQALAEAERAIALDPNNADGYANLVQLLVSLRLWKDAPVLEGRMKELPRLVEQAKRLNPRYYQRGYSLALGGAYLLTGQYEEAIKALKKGSACNSIFAHLNLAFAYLALGQEENARAEAADLLRIDPSFNPEGLKQNPYKDPEELLQALDTMRKSEL